MQEKIELHLVRETTEIQNEDKHFFLTQDAPSESHLRGFIFAKDPQQNCPITEHYHRKYESLQEGCIVDIVRRGESTKYRILNVSYEANPLLAQAWLTNCPVIQESVQLAMFDLAPCKE